MDYKIATRKKNFYYRLAIKIVMLWAFAAVANTVILVKYWPIGWLLAIGVVFIDLLLFVVGGLLLLYSTFQRKMLFDSFIKSVNNRLKKNKISNRSNMTYFEYWADFTLSSDLGILAEEYVHYQRARANVPAARVIEWDESIHQKLDGILTSMVEELPSNLKLTKNIIAKIGDRNSSPVTKLVMAKTANDYLNKMGLTIELGPIQSREKPLQERTNKAKVKTKAPIEVEQTLTPIEPHKDNYLSLRDHVNQHMPVKSVEEVIPRNHNAFMVWAIMIDLLEPGKAISMAGGWKRKQELTMRKVFNMHALENKPQPSEKLFKQELNWLRQIGVLDKRSHGNDYSINFVSTGKPEVCQKLIQLALSLKSARNGD